MAGSYHHVVTEDGNLRSNESFAKMIENLGDAYEAVEEMYGMIWWLAEKAHMALGAAQVPRAPEDLVERARQNYVQGLEIAKRNKNKRKRNSG